MNGGIESEVEEKSDWSGKSQTGTGYGDEKSDWNWKKSDWLKRKIDTGTWEERSDWD